MNFRLGLREGFADGWKVACKTGTIGAGLADGACIFTLRYPAAATKRFYIQRINLHFICIVSFATPVTAGRSLGLFRHPGADFTGGAAIAPVRGKSDFAGTLPAGRIATTAALTASGTFETAPLALLALSHAGSSGADYDETWRWIGNEADPLILNPGEMIGLNAVGAFDAAGTWQLTIKADGAEAP